MLVVVKDGHVAKSFESSFHLEASRRGYVFEIYSAETRAYVIYGGNYLVNVLRLYADRDCVYAGKLVEKHAFAFHDGHTRFRAYVAKPQNCRAVGDDCHGVPPASE